MEDSELCWSLRLHGWLLCPANGKRKELKGNGNIWICLHALVISHILQSLLLSLKSWYPALGVAIDPQEMLTKPGISKVPSLTETLPLF